MVLYPHQVPHFEQVLSIYQRWFSYLDSSQTGSGKTIITLEVSKALNLPLLVVGEVSTEGMWRQTAEKYGATLIDFLSYARLRGNNKYLIKGEDFQVSPHLASLLKKGILVVYDESHNLKNKSQQSKAAYCISEYIVLHSEHSRIACLSATPIDKQEQVLSLMRIMGVVTYDKLYEYNRSPEEYVLTGMQEMINLCELLEPQLTDDIVPRNISRHNAKQVSFKLFTDVIKPHLSSAIEGQLELPSKDIRNGYYRIEDEQLREGIGKLSKLVRRSGDDFEMDPNNRNWGKLTSAMRTIEHAKVNTMVRLARQTLANPQAKVILYFNYLDCIAQAERELEQFYPLVMKGDTKRADRDAIINAFNAPHGDYRLLIANTRVAGTGINLDDTTGAWPRFMFMIPTYNFIDLHQATGRIHRVTTKSPVTIRLVYGKEDDNQCLEHAILTSLQRKSATTRGAVMDQSIIYPGEYPIYIEEGA